MKKLNIIDKYVNAASIFTNNFTLQEGKIENFNDFLARIQSIDFDIKPPFIQRIPIGPSKNNPHETKSVRQILNAGKAHGNHIWQRRVRVRRIFTVAISLIFSLILFLISISSFFSKIDSEILKYLFCIIYFILTYHTTSSLLKILIGNLIAAKDKGYKQLSFAENYDKNTKVAVLYPVYHENPANVVSSIMAIWEDLGKIKDIQNHYEFYILSDSRSFQSRILEEEAIILAKQRIKNIKLYYRWRSINGRAKLGNIMDFLRRYSRRYKYMIVMDADSLMSGMAIHQMVSIAEQHDEIGIIQTNPKPILRATIFGRIFQFASWAYSGPFFRAIRHYYLGDAFYVGHNALLRLETFRNYCTLPELTGDPPWGGKPLSHDLVEASLMAKAGLEVWFLPEIEGSFEEIPSNIIAFLIRERRWMQGNLQNLRVAFGFGLKNAHRDLLISGFMSYFSSILWFMLIVITVIGNIDFDTNYRMKIDIINLQLSTMFMLISIFILLFLPRVIGILFVIFQKKTKDFGGTVWFLLSCIIDTLFSMILAPIIMVFIMKFFVLWIKSLPVKWGTQNREDNVLPWQDCFHEFMLPLIIGIIIFTLIKINDFGLLWDNNDFYNFFIPKLSLGDRYLWFLPIILSLILSPMVARLSSFTLKHSKFNKLFTIPEEIQKSQIITRMEFYLDYLHQNLPDLKDENEALIFAYTDPAFFVYHYQLTFNRKIGNCIGLLNNNILENYNLLKKAFCNKKDFAYCHYNLTLKYSQIS